ncbi:hypothetical protein ES708_23046 [subsurface metagenome]
MGINPSQFPIIWQGIRYWMVRKQIAPAKLSSLTGYSTDRIEKGIGGGTEWLSSDFVHDCVDAFGLISARNRSVEDTADVFTDEECIQLLTSPLKVSPHQGGFWE